MVETSVKIHRRDIEELASKSLVNCHTVGVDSVMLRDVNEDRLRAFVAHDNHDLWKNYSLGERLSIAMHSHHCDVTLIPIFGSTFNVEFRHKFLHGDCLSAYKYESQINGTGKFTHLKDQEIFVETFAYFLGSKEKMNAKKMHTVYVPRDKASAWFVHEGKEDPSYNSMCYSNSDLTKFDFEPLYKPMSVDRFKLLLETLRVEVVK